MHVCVCVGVCTVTMSMCASVGQVSHYCDSKCGLTGWALHYL